MNSKYVIVVVGPSGELAGVCGPFDGAPDHDPLAKTAWDRLNRWVGHYGCSMGGVWVCHPTAGGVIDLLGHDDAYEEHGGEAG